jgi:hypothetical protein
MAWSHSATRPTVWVDARLRELEDLIPAIQFEHAFFAGLLPKRHEQHQHIRHAANFRVPTVKGDLVRRQAHPAPMRDHL